MSGKLLGLTLRWQLLTPALSWHKEGAPQFCFMWLPKVRNKMAIPIQRSHNKNMFQLWCGFRHQKETQHASSSVLFSGRIPLKGQIKVQMGREVWAKSPHK
jgi:hypothetical protein